MRRQPVSLRLCVVWVNHHEKDHPTAGLPFSPAPVFCHVPPENKARFQRLMWGYKGRRSPLDSLDREIVSPYARTGRVSWNAHRNTMPLCLFDGRKVSDSEMGSAVWKARETPGKRSCVAGRSTQYYNYVLTGCKRRKNWVEKSRVGFYLMLNKFWKVKETN